MSNSCFESSINIEHSWNFMASWKINIISCIAFLINVIIEIRIVQKQRDSSKKSTSTNP